MPPRRRRASAFACLALSLLLLPTACGDSVESQLAEVRSLQEAGQFDPSIAPLRKILASDSGHPEANFRLGVALMRTGRPSLAVWPLQKASETDDYAVPAGLLLASTLARNQSYEESIRAATRVLERDPENAAALSTRAQANISAGFPEKALEDAERMLELRPGDVNAMMLKGSALMDLNRPDEAEATIKQVAEEAAESGDENDAARKCAALATFYRSQGADDRAREVFEDCIARYPTHPLLQTWVSDFYLDIGEADAAIEIWRKAVENTPEDLGLRSRLADLLYGQGRKEEALAVLTESVELFDTPAAWRLLSSYHRKAGDPEAARKALEEALARSRAESMPMQFALADMLIEEGDYERAEEIAVTLKEPAYQHFLHGAILLKKDQPKEALERFDAGLRLWPNNAGARYLAGAAALELGDRERAIAEFREAVRVGEEETDAALRLAELHFAYAQYRPALQFADRHIRKRPYVEPTAHIIAARSATALSLYDRADSILKNLAAKDPEGPTVVVELAHVQRTRTGNEAALAVILESGLDLSDPANVDALRAVASDLIALGRTEEALKRTRAAADAHPGSADLLELHGRVLLRAGNDSEAIAVIDRALATEPGHAPALQAKGDVLQARGDLAGALDYYRRAHEANPENADYAYQTAQLLLASGKQDEAIELLEVAVRIDPAHARASNDLAWLLASRGGNLDRALKLAQQAVRMARSAETLDTLGYVHLRKGDAEEAVSVLGKALEARPDSPSIEYRLGVALAAKGEKEEAKAILTKALESSPAFPEAEAARAELARLQDS